MPERICVVSRDRRDLFEELSQQFREVPDVRVIFDRRIGQRRRANPSPKTDNRRRGERRQFRTDLRLLGWMVTSPDQAWAMPLAEARPA